MTTEKSKRANRIFAALCNLLDAYSWHYHREEDDLSIACGAQGDDLPMAITIKVDAEKQLIQLVSCLPFVVSEEQRLDFAIAVSVTNKKLADGSFDYDIHEGNLFFRMTSSFLESDINRTVFAYLLAASCSTIDAYNDKFFRLGTGDMSLEDFISGVCSRDTDEEPEINASQIAIAQSVFRDLCCVIEKKGWQFKKHEKKLVVTCRVPGKDLPMDFVLIVDAERQLLKVLSRLPFTVPEDKGMQLAIAACVATYGLVDGSFDYDLAKGTIDFRLTAAFGDGYIGEGLFAYLVEFSSTVVDRYNDRFLALCKGLISISAFIVNG